MCPAETVSDLVNTAHAVRPVLQLCLNVRIPILIDDVYVIGSVQVDTDAACATSHDTDLRFAFLEVANSLCACLATDSACDLDATEIAH
jgi:hypothetical protein